MIKLDYQSRVPAYRQLKDEIIEMILLSVYPAESQLPSVRSLATELGLNPNTVQKAYQELESDGIIYSVSGKGSFVRGKDSACNLRRRQILTDLTGLFRSAKNAQIPQREITDLLQQEYEVKKND